MMLSSVVSGTPSKAGPQDLLHSVIKDAWPPRLATAATDCGRGHFGTYADGECVTDVVNARPSNELHTSVRAPVDLLLIRVAVESACIYAFSCGTTWRFVRPGISVSYCPGGRQIGIQLEAGLTTKAVTLRLPLATLAQRFGLQERDLPPPLLAAINGDFGGPVTLASMPLDEKSVAVVEDLVHMPLPGSLHTLQIRARTHQLLLLMLGAWCDKRGSSTLPRMRTRDQGLVTAARRILVERMASPPTLHELARELGTNRNKLNKIFQHGVGETVKAFCVRHRIERAQVLLREGRLSIAQIADLVGYRHQSSFAAAFRDAVGVCPRDYSGQRGAEMVVDPMAGRQASAVLGDTDLLAAATS